MNKIKKTIIYIATLGLSITLVYYTGVIKDSIFESNNLLTYCGVLIGFGLTLYTFALSILKDLEVIINRMNFRNDNVLEIIKNELQIMFEEIKSDIIIMFLSIILIFIASILKNTINPFGWELEYLQIPEIIKMCVFILTTLSLADIMFALFNISTIIFSSKKIRH